MTSDGVLDAIVADDRVDRCLDGEAVVGAMLDFEAALARACATAGLIPSDAATAITAAATSRPVRAVALAERTALGGTPVIPLVEDLTAAVGAEHARWVHFGATSQDTLDSALAVLSRRVTGIITADLRAAATSCADLAQAEAATPIVGRTLGQHAQPTSFGLKAAGWCVSLWRAHDGIRVAAHDLAVQLGGAVGTLASFDGHGLDIAAAVAADLGLTAPTLPWHTERSRVLRLAAALGEVCAAWSKVAADVLTLAQTEIAEVSEATPGGGRSSAMPHKRNPAVAMSIRAGALRAPGLVGTLFAAAAQENERSAGGWQAEWWTLRELLRVAGAVAARGAALMGVLVIDRARMDANLHLTGGLILSERLATALTPSLGRLRAQAVVRELSERVTTSGRSLRDVAGDDDRVRAAVSPADLDRLLDPAAAVGEATALVERALAVHREHR